MFERCRTRGCRCVVVEDGLCRTCAAGEVWREEGPVLPASLAWLSLDLLEATVAQPGWEQFGVCYRQGNTDLFFLERGDSAGTKPARDLCSECPAVYECLRVALDTQSSAQDHGIWGNTSVLQRRKLRRVLEQRAMRRELKARVAS